MTFLEAAIEVLRREGRPLHYDRITELAIKLKLLSHVGKDPETTMAARLASQVKLARPDSPLVRIKPGVFALSEWKGSPPGPRRPAPSPKEPQPPREELALVEEAGGAAPAEKAPRGAEAEAAVAPREAGEAGSRRSRNAREADTRSKRVSRVRAERATAARTARSTAEEKRTEVRRSERSRREDRSRSPEATKASPEAPRSLPMLLEEALRASPGARTAPELAQALSARGVPSSPDALVAALAVDNVRRRSLGFSPLFSQNAQGAYALAEKEGPSRLRALEADLYRVAREHLDEIVREVGSSLASLGEGALLQLATLALEQAGWGEVYLLKRSSEGNFILLAESTRSLARQKSLVFIRRAGPAVSGKEVAQLRENFSQYDAQSGIIFALTGLSDAARVEAEQKAALPVFLFDERVFAKLLVEAGVGVSISSLPVYQLDRAFFAALTTKTGNDQ